VWVPIAKSSGAGKAKKRDELDDGEFELHPRGGPKPPQPPKAPGKGQKLPVLVWIHGGGYGLGDSRTDMGSLIGTNVANGHPFIVVSIQYRLGVFGWASSAELVREGGVANAGLLDQRQALRWVKKYIGKFGGDSERVTISGESAGGGSVLYHTIGDGGAGEGLFEQVRKPLNIQNIRRRFSVSSQWH
jgi:poly(3-hydroxybutyrate) depolymerase